MFVLGTAPCHAPPAALKDVLVVNMAGGAHHSCMVTDSGDVYLCGFGEFFHPNETEHFWQIPKRLTAFQEPIKQVRFLAGSGMSRSLIHSFARGKPFE